MDSSIELLQMQQLMQHDEENYENLNLSVLDVDPDDMSEGYVPLSNNSSVRGLPGMPPQNEVSFGPIDEPNLESERQLRSLKRHY